MLAKALFPGRLPADTFGFPPDGPQGTNATVIAFMGFMGLLALLLAGGALGL